MLPRVRRLRRRRGAIRPCHARRGQRKKVDTATRRPRIGDTSSSRIIEATRLRRYARFSPDRRYRWLLGRELPKAQGDLLAGWESPAGDGPLLFIMLNPSIADGRRDDPTLRRCIRFATTWGFTRLEIANLFARVCTDPDALFDDADPVGPRNDAVIRRATRRASLVICAWGASGGRRTILRAAEVVGMLHAEGVRLHHLGLTASGIPKHPLYLPADARPAPWLELLP
jgi:hypothetical protein